MDRKKYSQTSGNLWKLVSHVWKKWGLSKNGSVFWESVCSQRLDFALFLSNLNLQCVPEPGNDL